MTQNYIHQQYNRAVLGFLIMYDVYIWSYVFFINH